MCRMDEGFQETFEDNNVKVNPILMLWKISNRIDELNKSLEYDDIDEINYESGMYDQMKEEKSFLNHIGICLLEHSFHEMNYPKSKVLEYDWCKRIIFETKGSPFEKQEERLKEVQ